MPDLKLIKAVDYDTLVSSGIQPIFHFVLNVTVNRSSSVSILFLSHTLSISVLPHIMHILDL